MTLALLCNCTRSLAAPAPAREDDPRVQAAHDAWRQPDRLVAALGLRAGQRVADVGAGTGYLTFRLATAVGPSGRVVATDIDPVALAALRTRSRHSSNIAVRAVTASDPGLEANSYDLVLLSEVDQYLPDRVAYLTRLRESIAPGGRIAVANRRNFRAPLLAAAARAGLTVSGEFTSLPFHSLVFFEVANR